MRLSVVLTAFAGLIAGCAEAPTQPGSGESGSAAFARGSAQGAEFITVSETGVNLPLPGIGSCVFLPDGSGQFNNFLRGNPDGSHFLKIEDASGTLVVTPFGGQTWIGTGHVSVNWPNYPDGTSFELTMNGTVLSGGRAMSATCKDLIVKGVAVETFIKLH
jgi:hypothetical protein